MAAAEIGRIEFGQVIDMRARIGEGAAFRELALEADDAMHGFQPLRRLEDLPARELAKADFENVEIEGRIEVVAVGPVAREIVDPGDDAALVVDMVVQR